MNVPFLLAAITKYSGAGEGARYLRYVKEPLVVILAVIPLAVGFFIWAKASSRKRRHHKRRRAHLTPEQSRALVESWKVMHGSRHRRKHHHRREPSNPTLAETGGLPPRRSEAAAATDAALPPPATVPPLPFKGNVPPNPPSGSA